jgi:hypothetical protein
MEGITDALSAVFRPMHVGDAVINTGTGGKRSDVPRSNHCCFEKGIEVCSAVSWWPVDVGTKAVGRLSRFRLANKLVYLLLIASLSESARASAQKQQHGKRNGRPRC